MSDDLRLLVTGISTRAVAESAARAGFQVTALDAFGDLDQHPAVRALSLLRDFGVAHPTAHAAARACRDVSCDVVAYLSPFENAPRAVMRLREGRVLWGNPPDVLRRVRDPFHLMQTLRRRGIATPATRANDREAIGARHEWLLKRMASGGGRQVVRWHRGMAVPRGAYLQERIEGSPGSIVFAAAAGHAVPLGVTRQLIGDPAFGASGYRYCGNILGSPGSESFGRALVDRAIRLAEAVASDFDLVGLNGIDFIARDDVPVPIEVNPRWSSSMELVEQVSGVPVFGLHAAACGSGSLAAGSATPPAASRVVGKAVVFARTNLVVPDTRRWLDDDTLRDVPRAGEPIAAGRPVCTVFARGADDSGCYAALIDRAARLYDELDRRVG